MNTTKHEKNNILLQFWVKETPFKKKKVSVWHTMKWTSRLWLPKNSGSLHIMIFRYCGNISVIIQRYFLKVKGVKKFMLRCHTLTHGTDLRRLPLYSRHKGPEANFCSQKYQRFCFSQVVGFNIFATSSPRENIIYQVWKFLFDFYRSQSTIIYILSFQRLWDDPWRRHRGLLSKNKGHGKLSLLFKSIMFLSPGFPEMK